MSRQVGTTTLHANLGVVFDREADADMRRTRQTWTIAVEHEARSRWTVVAELFGQRGVRQSAQFGFRWWAIPKHVQLTMSLGTQRSMGSAGRCRWGISRPAARRGDEGALGRFQQDVHGIGNAPGQPAAWPIPSEIDQARHLLFRQCVLLRNCVDND